MLLSKQRVFLFSAIQFGIFVAISLVISGCDANKSASLQDAYKKFFKAYLNVNFGDAGIRDLIIDFFELLPENQKQEVQLFDAKHTLGRTGKNRLQKVGGGGLDPCNVSGNENPACYCKELIKHPTTCKRPKCPSVPPSDDRCAGPPLCSKGCVLKRVRPDDVDPPITMEPSTLNTTTSDKTLTEPTTTNKPSKRDAKKRISTSNSTDNPDIKKYIERLNSRKNPYHMLGVERYYRIIENVITNSTNRKKFMRMVDSMPKVAEPVLLRTMSKFLDEKFRDKLADDLIFLIQIGERGLAELELLADAYHESIITAGVKSILGHVLERHSYEHCPCKNPEQCTLSEDRVTCEASCPNNPGCVIFQCECVDI